MVQVAILWIAVLSRRLAVAVPDETVKAIALRSGHALSGGGYRAGQGIPYRLWSEQPGQQKVTWEWVAGVNYFSAQGDGRWWQDHREVSSRPRFFGQLGRTHGQIGKARQGHS